MKRFLSNGPKRLARSFLAGLLAVLPVVITLAIIAWVAGFVRQFLGPRTLVGDGLTHVGLRLVTNDTAAYLIGGLLALGCVLLLGMVVEAGAKGFVQRLCDGAMQRIPIVGGIYGTSKQLVTLFDKKDAKKLQGMKAVFCFFGENTGVGSPGPAGLTGAVYDQRPTVPHRDRAHGTGADRRRAVLRARGNGAAHRRERRRAAEHLRLDGRQRAAVFAWDDGLNRHACDQSIA